MRINRLTRLHRLALAVVTAIAATTAVSAQEGATYNVVSSFDSTVGRPNGVIQARDGQFYGTTSRGPVSISLETIGTVFAMNAAGARTTLKIFQQSIVSFLFDGTPMSNLFEGSDGNLYGTTYNLASSPFTAGQIFRSVLRAHT